MDGEPLITEFVIDGLGVMKFFLAPKIKSEWIKREQQIMNLIYAQL